MRKLGTVLAACALMLGFCNQASAQIEEGQIDLNLGLGLGVRGVTGDIGIPPISISGDYAITDEFTAGGYLGYYSSSTESFGYTFNYSYTIIGVRGTYHREFVENLDTYGGAMLGYNVGTSSVDEPAGANPAFSPQAQSVGGIAYSFLIGARYHFTDNIGAFAELGYGISYLSLGLTYRIN